MSSSVLSALPSTARVFEYDEDGDAIMYDASTGLPIQFAAAAPAPRRGSTGTLIASPLPDEDGAAAPAPPAPKKAAVGPPGDGDGAESAVRNLAEAMAEAVLAGEPREESAPPAAEPVADEGAAAAAAPAEEEGWCVSVTCADLALRLDMRHPRVVLNLFRFVATYNELAPAGEDIHLPLLSQERADFILNHDSVVNPAPEFAAEVEELRALVQRFTCSCNTCQGVEDDDRYSTDSEDSYRDRYRYRYREW